MGGGSGFDAPVSAGAGSSMDAERFGAGMNLADIGAGLASKAGLGAGFAGAGGSSSGVTSDAGCAAAEGVRDGASAMGSPVGVAAAVISVRSIGADAADWRMIGDTFPNVSGETVPIMYTGAALSSVAGAHAAMANPPSDKSAATPIVRCRRNVPLRMSPSRLAPRRAWR
jgi:hypothetical protein